MTHLTTNFVIKIFQPFKNKSGEKLIVDVVTESGAKWIKIIARNAQSIYSKFIRKLIIICFINTILKTQISINY
jgi:hypothetical protein